MGHTTPLTKIHTLGSSSTPPCFHAGGLRYHGMSPLVSHLTQLGRIEATADTQNECSSAGVFFACAEGIVPAPEANHTVKGAVEEALRCKREGRRETILFNLCGHGHFDMAAATRSTTQATSRMRPATRRNWRWPWPGCRACLKRSEDLFPRQRADGWGCRWRIRRRAAPSVCPRTGWQVPYVVDRGVEPPCGPRRGAGSSFGPCSMSKANSRISWPSM